MDKTAFPWIALAIGVVMLVVWFVLLSRVARIPVSPRPRRFDLSQMSTSEKRWTLGWFAFLCGLIALLNGAATVDWGPMGSAFAAGRVGPILLAIGLVVFGLVMAGGMWVTWGRASRAYATRVSSSRPGAAAKTR